MDAGWEGAADLSKRRDEGGILGTTAGRPGEACADGEFVPFAGDECGEGRGGRVDGDGCAPPGRAVLYGACGRCAGSDDAPSDGDGRDDAGQAGDADVEERQAGCGRGVDLSTGLRGGQEVPSGVVHSRRADGDVA